MSNNYFTMKVPIIISILIFAFLFVLSGCDSPTDSKATPVTSPTLVAPTDGDTTVSLTPTFQWTGAGDKLEISIYESFTNVLFSTNVSGNSFPLPSGNLQHGKYYFWHVANSTSGQVYWSLTYKFKTTGN